MEPYKMEKAFSSSDKKILLSDKKILLSDKNFLLSDKIYFLSSNIYFCWETKKNFKLRNFFCCSCLINASIMTLESLTFQKFSFVDTLYCVEVLLLFWSQEEGSSEKVNRQIEDYLNALLLYLSSSTNIFLTHEVRCDAILFSQAFSQFNNCE